MPVPIASERTETDGSPTPKSGAVMPPPVAALVYSRIDVPPTQRTPRPNTVPPPTIESPCSRMLVAFGFSPLVVKTRLSIDRYAMPVADRIAPPVVDALSQPRGATLGGFEQGQVSTPATPGSHRLVKTE